MSLNAPFFPPCVSLSSETGSAITSSCIGLGNSLTPPAGQAGKPVPGYNGKRQSCRATSWLHNAQNTNQPLPSLNFLCICFYIFKFNFTFRSLFQCTKSKLLPLREDKTKQRWIKLSSCLYFPEEYLIYYCSSVPVDDTPPLHIKYVLFPFH